MFNKIFIAFYLHFKQRRSSIAKLQSLGFVLIFQFIIIAILFILIREVLFKDFDPNVKFSRIIVAPFVFAWLFLLHKYYSPQKISLIKESFKLRPLKYQRHG